MPEKGKSDTAEQTSIRKLVRNIQKEQQKIDRLEGDVVAAHIRVGNYLAQLRQLADGNWGRQLDALGMNPRVASRYMMIAKHWPSEIGLKESDLTRLPIDLLKLEWLCRVPLDKLGPLLRELDCKRVSRRQVIAAVRDVLNEAPSAKTEKDVERFVERFTNRIMRTVDKLHETFPESEQQNHARELLVTRLQEVRVAVEARISSRTKS